MTKKQKTGAILVSHGSPRSEANQQFQRKMDRVARRLEGMPVVSAFFSIARPTIAEKISELAEQGVEHVIVLPYFLHNGQHIRVDLPEQLEECRAQFPDMTIELTGTLRDEPGLEDMLVHRLAEYAEFEGPVDRSGARGGAGAAIERTSHGLIDQYLDRKGLQGPDRAIIRRAIHATADFSFADTMRIHPDAVQRGVEALRSGGPVVCDVNMLRSGITRVDCEVLCAIADRDVAEQAQEHGTTRSAAAMEKLARHFEGAIVAIGNAPTALWQVLDIARRGGPRPALVVGVPVGFVGALESKIALLNSDLCYVTNVGNRGGTPVAAAVVNALAFLAKEES
jgi:precorrin-8X/cobalt-precorrin-8 methylmutase